jgi:RNase P subunit RPR2
MFLARMKQDMSMTCQHCGELIVGNAYRVTSEEAGVILLDMVVCSLCSAEAKRLHLHTEDLEVGSKQAPDQFRAAHR